MRNDWDAGASPGEDVTTIAIEDLDLGVDDPEVEEEIRAIEAAAEAGQARYTMALAALRQAMGLTQAALADRIGADQPAISVTEHREDMLISTLAGYVRGLGLDLRLVVSGRDGVEADIDIAALARGKAS